MATSEETIALVEGFARIAREFRLDSIQAGEIRIERSQHEMAVVRRDPEPDEEDVLFHSAGEG